MQLKIGGKNCVLIGMLYMEIIKGEPNYDNRGKITKLRKEAGLSQEAFSEELNISRQAVSKWENGTAQPTNENLNRIAKFFGVTVSSLLDGEEILTEDLDRKNLEEKPKKKFSWNKIISILLVLVITFQFIIILRLKAVINDNINNLTSIDNLQRQINVLNSRINNIYIPTTRPSNEDFLESSYEVLGYDRKTNTAEVKVSFVPKNYNENTKSEILLKGEKNEYSATAEMVNGSFIAVLSDVVCDSDFSILGYLIEDGNTRSFSMGRVENPNTGYILNIGNMCINQDSKGIRLYNGKVAINVELGVELTWSPHLYPKKAVVQVLSDGVVIDEMPYESLMEENFTPSGTQSSVALAESAGEIVSSNAYFFHYIEKTIENKAIKATSNIEFKLLLTDNMGVEYEQIITNTNLPI